jgi:hypothetical protein
MAFDPTQPFEVVEDPQAQAGGAPRFDPSQAFEVVDDGQTGLIEGVGNSIKRGWTMSQMASEMEKPAPDPQRVAALQQEMKAVPPSDEYMTVMDDRRAPEESWTAFKSAPVKVLAELMGESFSAFAGQMIEKAPNRVAIGLGAGAAMGAPVAGIGAVPGGFIGAGAGFAEASGAASYSLEMAGGVLEAMEQAGVPLDNPEALGQALQDPQRMQLAREFAQRKAVPIAIFDGASAVIGGRMFGGGKVTSAMQRLGQGMAETFTQAAMGASGEASGQLAQSGGITSGRAILAEGVAEIPTGLLEIGAGQLSQSGATANQPTATAPAAAPAAAPQPAPFTPPPAAETVVVEETFGEPTTAAAEPVAAAAPAFDPSQPFEVVQEPSETIVTEPPAAAPEVPARVQELKARLAEADPMFASPEFWQPQDARGYDDAAIANLEQTLKNFTKPKKSKGKKAAPAQANPVADIWEKYDSTGEIDSPMDLADAVDAMLVNETNPVLEDAVREYRAAIEQDFDQFGGRGEDGYTDRFVAAVQQAAQQPAPMPGQEAATPKRKPTPLEARAKKEGYELVYHGDRNEPGNAEYQKWSSPNLPLFTAYDKESAEWFGSARPLFVKTSRVATQQDLIQVAQEQGVQGEYTDPAEPVSIPEVAQNSQYEGTNINDLVYIPRVRQSLADKGFDAVRTWDQLERDEVDTLIVIGSPDQVVDPADTPAKRSRARIKKMTAQSGAIDLSIVEDLVEYGKTIYRAGMSFGKWAGQMVKEFGQGIASFLKQAFDRIVQAYKDSPYSDTTGAVGNVQPKKKPRQFEQKAAKAPGISEEARAQMGDDPYVPITLRGVAEQAKAWIAENGIEAAERRILGLADEGQTPTPLDFAIGLELTANLSATGNAGRAAAVVRTMSRRATSLGQTISTLAMLSRLTPEGIVFYANQIIEQHISSLTPERQAEIRAAQDDVANLEETVATTRKRTAEDAIINGTQGGEKIQDKLKRRIPDKAKKQDTNVSIRSVLTSQATKAEATKQITQILTESGISQSEATALATAITNRFYKVLEDARKALATSRKPAKGKGRATIDKLLTQLKDGKISDQEFVATLGQLVGVPGLTPELRKKLDNLTRQYKAATDDDIALVLAARIFEEVHGLVPADFWVKLRAVSYLSMLFSPRTWIRNLGGNQIQWLTDIGIDSAISMVFDPIASIFTGKRTTAGVYVGTRIKALLAPVQDVIKGYKWNAKQNPSANVIDNIFAGLGHLRVLAKLTTQNKFDIVDAKEVGRRIFSNKFMQLWEGALSIALGGGDRAFWMSGFRASLARREAAAKKNGTWTGQPTPEDVDAAYADAMYAIYQNPNVLSKNSNKIRQALNRLSTFGKTDQFGLGTGLLAFTQVPGSLSLRGLIEMSPLGLVTALYEGMRPVLFKASGGRAGGNFRQEEFNKALSRAMVGSGMFYAGGYWLYAMGIITASREEDDDLEAMHRASGMGAYRINVSALKRMLGSGNFYVRQTAQDGDLIVSYDWAQPVAITFAAGAELAKMVEENDRNGIKKGWQARLAWRPSALLLAPNHWRNCRFSRACPPL